MITLENWAIVNVFDKIRLSGRVVEDKTGRYKPMDHILSDILLTVYFDTKVAYDTNLVEYKLSGDMRKN